MICHLILQPPVEGIIVSVQTMCSSSSYVWSSTLRVQFLYCYQPCRLFQACSIHITILVITLLSAQLACARMYFIQQQESSSLIAIGTSREERELADAQHYLEPSQIHCTCTCGYCRHSHSTSVNGLLIPIHTPFFEHFGLMPMYCNLKTGQ